jgi:uncharacterized protein (TIGR02266 family)
MPFEPFVDEPCPNLGEALFRADPVDRAARERRAVPRYAVELEVTIHSEHNFYDGLVRNMGVAGVFVATHASHAVGEYIDLSIRLPGLRDPVKVIGEVRWTRQHREGSTEPGIGIKFGAISDHDLAAVRDFLRDREPLLYED